MGEQMLDETLLKLRPASRLAPWRDTPKWEISVHSIAAALLPHRGRTGSNLFGRQPIIEPQWITTATALPEGELCGYALLGGHEGFSIAKMSIKRLG